MPRIRTVKPGYFTNEDIAELPIEARYLFIGLWAMADREGRLEWRPKYLKLHICPWDSLDFDKATQPLFDAGFMTKYEVNGKLYACVKNFTKHQRITGTEAKSESEIPPCTDFGNNLETTWKQLGNNLDDKERITGLLDNGLLEEGAKEPETKKTFDQDQRVFIESIKSEYPKRNGDLCWKKAETKIRAIPIKERESVIAGVVGYRQHCEKTKKVGTEFVKQASTFFNNDTWKEFTPSEEKKPTNSRPIEGVHYDIVTIAGEKVKVIPGSDELFDEESWRSA